MLRLFQWNGRKLRKLSLPVLLSSTSTQTRQIQYDPSSKTYRDDNIYGRHDLYNWKEVEQEIFGDFLEKKEPEIKKVSFVPEAEDDERVQIMFVINVVSLFISFLLFTLS